MMQAILLLLLVFVRIGFSALFLSSRPEADPTDFIPKEFMDFLDSIKGKEFLTLDKVHISFVNKSLEEIADDFFAVLKKESPTLEANTRKLYELEVSKVANLSEPTQDFIKNIVLEHLEMFQPFFAIDDVAQLNDTDIRHLVRRSFEIGRQIFDYLNEHEEAKIEIGEQWPEIGAFFKSEFYSAFEKMATPSPRMLAFIEEQLINDLKHRDGLVLRKELFRNCIPVALV